MESIFENTFVIGLIIGLVLFPLVDWIDEIIYHVNNINNEKENITTTPKQQTDI